MGVGKTSFLAAGLVSPAASTRSGRRVDWSASDDAYKQLQLAWTRLEENENVPNTNPLEMPMALELTGGGRVVLRDVRGGATLRVYEEGNKDLIGRLVGARGVLFMLEWPGPESAGQIAALLQGANQLGERLADKVTGVAFTRCERYLRHEDRLWELSQAEAAIWAGPKPVRERWWYGSLRSLQNEELELLNRLGPAWLTSAFGFRREQNGRPACLLDEFGGVIPYGVQPRNVVEVIEWFLHRLAPAQSP
jgi:hypothetical protein